MAKMRRRWKGAGESVRMGETVVKVYETGYEDRIEGGERGGRGEGREKKEEGDVERLGGLEGAFVIDDEGILSSLSHLWQKDACLFSRHL
jgi:hypothetical protein